MQTWYFLNRRGTQNDLLKDHYKVESKLYKSCNKNLEQLNHVNQIGLTNLFKATRELIATQNSIIDDQVKGNS